MFERSGRLWRTAMWTAVLAVGHTGASAPANSAEPEDALQAATANLRELLLDTRFAEVRPPIDSDDEHARSIDPVLTPGATIWIHENLPSAPLTVVGGRVFTYRDLRHNPLDSPILKVRAIDDDQVVSFLVRVEFRPEHLSMESATIEIRFPVPNIFDPSIENASAWIDSEPVRATVFRSVENGTVALRIPLGTSLPRTGEKTPDLMTVITTGDLVLQPYRTLSRSRFATLDDTVGNPTKEDFSTFEKDCALTDGDELISVAGIAAEIGSESITDYQRIETLTEWTGNRLRYKESPASRTVSEILVDGDGDCDDYAELARALMCVSGIPARIATGQLYDFNLFSAHAWVEAALPTLDEKVRWFICDPTLSGSTASAEPATEFVQYRNRVLLYPVRPVIAGSGLAGRLTSDVLLNWRSADSDPPFDSIELDRLVDLTIAGVDREIVRGAERLAHDGLRLPRESATIPGSSYIVVDRPVRGGSDARVQLRLENEERLVLDLSAGVDSALESSADIRMTNRFRSAYRKLNNFFFAGNPAHFNIELLFLRDPHSDRLHTVRMRIGRFLVESDLDRILNALANEKILTEEETTSLTRIANASRGVNLYISQELAREITQ